MYDKKDSWWFWHSDYFLRNQESLETFEYAVLLAAFQKKENTQMAALKTANKAPNRLLNQSVTDPREKAAHFFAFSALRMKR